tara:strand:+ start:5735 stop:8746 length:3012 start_codon:yes stop_codon:yes gene_type:complete
METEVGSFRGVDNFEDGTKWNVDTALEFFYQFIIPQDQSKIGMQKSIRAGLIRWMRSKKKWDNNPTFKDAWDLDTFNSINKEAIDTLLDTKLRDLNNNRYYQQVEGEEQPKELKFSDRTIEIKDKDGNFKRLEVSYGRQFKANKKGLNVKDTDAYNIARNLLIEGKNELQALKLERDKVTGAAKSAFTKKINDLTNSISETEAKFNEQLKTMYNDDVTLRQVIENSPEVEGFYSAVTLEPQTEQQKVALGILIENVEKTIDESLYNIKYSMITGKELSYNEFEKEVKAREATYLKLLAVPLIVQSRLTGIDEGKEELDINVQVDKLITIGKDDKGNDIKPPLLELLQQIPYPITFSNEELDEITDQKGFVKFIKEKDIKTVVRLLDRALNMWQKKNLEPLINAQAKITVESTTLREAGKDDLSDRPVKMSRDTIEEFILDSFVNPDNINVRLQEVETNKTKFKLPIEIKKKAVDFESGYARTVGGASRDIINSESVLDKEINKEGKVAINYTGNIPKDIVQKLPGISGDYQWKMIRDVLTNFYRAKTTSTQERLENKVKKYITSNLVGDMEMVAGIISNLKELQNERLEKEDIIDLSDFTTSSYLKDNGSFKFTVAELRKNLVEDFSLKKTDNFINKLTIFQKTMNKVVNFAMENEELIEALDEANDEDDLTEEEFREQAAQESTKLRVQQERLEEAEQEKREAEDAMQGTEGEAAGQQMMVDESLEDFDDLTTGKTFELMKEEEFLNGLQDLIKYDTMTSNLDNRLTLLRRELRIVNNTRDINISTDKFGTILNEWGEMVEYDMGNLQNLISQIDEEKDEEGNFVNDMTELKEDIKEERLLIEEHWNNKRQDSKFKKPERADMYRLLNALDLRKGLSEDLSKNKLFNDGRNGKVSIEIKDMEVQIDYAKSKLLLKGQVLWQSLAESYIGYKIERGKSKSFIMPKVTGFGLTQSQKTKIGGKRVTPSGRIQDIGLRGENTDPDRLEFVENIRSRMNVLIQAVR